MPRSIKKENLQVRVLLINLSTRMGGASIRTLNLIKAMERGQCALAGLQGSPITEDAINSGLEIYIVGKNKQDINIIKNLVHLARTKGFTIFDTQNSQSKFWGTIASQLAGVYLISTLNSWYPDEYKGKFRGRFYHWIERLTTPWTDMFIPVSEDIKNKLHHYKIAKQRISLIPNAVPLNMMRLNKDRKWLTSHYNIPDSAIICVAVGRLVEAKGFGCLINCMNFLERDFHCLIIGEGHLRPFLMKQITDLGLENRVQLIGFCYQEELLNIVKLSDIYVMSSLTEGTPISLLEAATLAKPIVATQAGGIPEILQNGEHALLVSPGDAYQLAKAIQWVVLHSNEAQKMAMAGYEHVKRIYSMEAQVKATLEAYKRLLCN